MIRSKISSRFQRAKTMMFLWALLALALHVIPGAVDPARAQGSRKDDIVFNSRGIPLAGATVRVCAMPASGQPCTPLALIYSDAGLTQALANPTTTDGMGNYFFYAAPGTYEIEISGPGITTKQIPNVILPNDPASPTFSGGISAFSLSLAGNLTVNGNTTVLGNMASGTLNLSNQGTPPGTASSGTVNLYTKTADKRLYYKDDTGTEVGPLGPGNGAQTNTSNTFTAAQNFDNGLHIKGPDPYYDLMRFGAYQGSYPAAPTTTGNITAGQTTLTMPAAFDVANGQYVTVYGAGPAATIYTPGAPVPISSLTVSSNVATIYVPEWYCSPGQNITIAGSSDSAFNGTFTPNGNPANAACSFPVAHANCNPCTIGSSATVVGATPFVTSTSGILNGSTTYQYKIVAEDFFGGLSAASALIVVSNAAATLGTNSVTIAANGCSRDSTGLSTVTTTVAHNFAVGAYVHIVSGSTGDASFEGSAVIISTPTSATFTFYQYGAPPKTNSCSLGGTAKVVAKNIIRWNQRYASILGHWIYRCTGAGCTSYALIGHADGPDGAFTDWGLSGGITNQPGYVPATPPSAPGNQWLSAQVTAGSGTTTLTLSAAATNTVSAAMVLHDNTPAVLAACAAMHGQGGTIYFPDNGTPGAVYPISTNLDMRTACPSVTVVQAGRINAVAPILPPSRLKWIGAPEGSGGANASFAVAPQAQIFGNAFPVIYQTGSSAVSDTFENLQVNCYRNYQGCYYSDPTFSNGTNMIFRNFAAGGYPGTFPMRPSGQFFYVYEYTYFTNTMTESAWGTPEPFIETVPYGFGPSTGTTSMIYDVDFRFATFQGGGVLFESNGQTLGSGIESIKCQHCLLESSFAPLFRVNTPNSNSIAADWDLDYLSFADSPGGGAMPMIDVTNVQSVSGVRVFGATCANGGAPLFAVKNQPTAYSGFSVGATGACGIGASAAVNPDAGYFGNQPVSVGGTSPGFGYLMQPTPAAPTLSTSGSAGPAAGTYYYAALAYDVNGNSTLVSLPASITVNGSQGVLVSWTLLPGQAATTICRGSSPTSVLCAVTNPVYKIGGTSFLDTGLASYYFNASTPLGPTAASSSMTANGIQSTQLQLTGGGFVNTIAPPSTGFTANRVQTVPDNTGVIPVTSYLNSAYDNAIRANGAIGSNWTIQQNGLNIASNQIQGTTAAASNAAFWSAGFFSPVQFAQATITALNGASDYPGVTVRASGTGASSNYYDCVENSTTIYLQRIVNAVTTNLTTTASTGAAGDVLRLEAAPGGNLTCYKNGSAILTAADTQITSGSPGLLISGNVATEKNWSGGNLHPLGQLDVEADYTRVQHMNAGIGLGAETFTASPRAEQSVFLPGALTSTWTGATWTLDKSVTVTRVQVQAKTAPAGCATNAIVQLTDGTTPLSVTISAAANDSGALSQNYSAGSALQILVQTAATGCTTSPADANVIVQFRMQ